MKFKGSRLNVSIVLIGVLLFGCGDSSSSNPKSAISSGAESPGDKQNSNFNRGLTGTIYFKNGSELFDSLDVTSGSIRTVSRETGRFIHHSTSPDGSLHLTLNYFRPPEDVATLSQDATVFDQSGSEINSFSFAGDVGTSPVISHDNEYIAVIADVQFGQVSRGVHIYSRSGQLLRFIPDGSGRVFADVSWNPDGSLMMSSALDGLYILPDPLASEPQLLFKTSGYTMHDMTFSPDGKRLAYISTADRQIYSYDEGATEPRQITFSNAPYGVVNGFDWSPDSKFLVLVYFERDLGCTGSWLIFVDSKATAARLPSNLEEVKNESSSDQVFGPLAYLPGDGRTVLSRISCVGGDPSWR